MVAAPKEKFFRQLTTTLEREDLPADPRFCDFASRDRNRVALLAELEPIFLTRTAAEWTELLVSAGVPNGTVQSVEQALIDPQVLARGSVVDIPHPHWGNVRPAYRGDQAQLSRAPRRGEHSDQVLAGLLGYPSDKVAELARLGAFGGDSPIVR